jgi:hypothetical protein
LTLTMLASTAAALALLGIMGALGLAALQRTCPWLDPLERLAYGFPLGVVMATLALLPLAIAFGLTTLLVIGFGIACAVVTILLWPKTLKPASLSARFCSWAADRRARDGPGALARGLRAALCSPATPIIGALALHWAVFWSGALTFDAEGLWANQINIWGDWTQHLGDLALFVYGDNFPPEHPRFAGHTYPYHYLASLTAAALIKLGLGPIVALTLSSFLFSILIGLGIYAFARRLTLDPTAAGFALVLFLLGGGLGWVLTLAEIDRSHSFLGTLTQHPWDQAQQNAANFRWLNVYYHFIAPQRGYLYGLPLALLVLTLLYTAVQDGLWRRFVAAGLVAGLLPLAHLVTLLALALIAPFIFLLFPSRGWLLFFASWMVTALPQLYLQQGGGPGAIDAFRLQLGWIASPDPWPWFWLKNLGWFVPLLGLALAHRTLLPPASHRFLWGFMPLFVLANTFVFQPWDFGNHPILLYWFLAVCILVARLLVTTWRRRRTMVAHLLIASVVVSLTLSGILVNLHWALGKDRHLLLTREELMLAETLRDTTPPHAVFAAGLQHNHPVTVLSGRRVVLGYTGVLWAQGLDYEPRERDLRAIFALAPDAPMLDWSV